MKHSIIPIMPPLLNEEFCKQEEDNSNTFNGLSCENIVKGYFLSKGLNVAEPILDDGVDLLIERSKGQWVRSQVKKVVYRYKQDYNAKKYRNKTIHRSVFMFNFQGNSISKRKQRSPQDFDYFYHVLLTPLRQLIWEIPTNQVTLRSNGDFVNTKNIVLDREGSTSTPSDMNFRDTLIYSQFHCKVITAYPEFFYPEKKQLLDSFFV